MNLHERVGGPGCLAVILIVFIVVVLGCTGFLVHLQIPLTVAFGWPWYLWRVVPQLNPDPWAIGTAIVCFLGFTLGTHVFLKWLYAASATEPHRWQWKWTGLFVGLIVLMFTAGIAFIGVVHQTSWMVRSPEPWITRGREAPARAISSNNLKHMGLGTHNFHDQHLRLPQIQFDATGRAMHSWQTAILPFMEQNDVYRQIDLTKPWNDSVNATPLTQTIKVFWNPRASAGATHVNGYGVSHYAPNVNVVMGDAPRTLNSFTLGTSNTILAGEVSGTFQAWGDPLNVRDPRFGAHGHPQGFGGTNGQRPLFLMLDASVRTFDPTEYAEALRMSQE